MSMFRSKQTVEAFQWTGGPDQTEDPEWIVRAIQNGDVVFRKEGTEGVQMRVANLGAWHYANRGDWIICTDYPDRFMVLDDATFHERYEAVAL